MNWKLGVSILITVEIPLVWGSCHRAGSEVKDADLPLKPHCQVFKGIGCILVLPCCRYMVISATGYHYNWSYGWHHYVPQFWINIGMGIFMCFPKWLDLQFSCWIWTASRWNDLQLKPGLSVRIGATYAHNNTQTHHSFFHCLSWQYHTLIPATFSSR